MAITVVSSPDEFGFVLNYPAYVLQTDNTTAGVEIQIRIFVEDTPGSDTFFLAIQKRLFPDLSNQVEVNLSGLKSYLKTEIPDLSNTSIQVVPNASRKYKISYGELIPGQNQIISENYHESTDPFFVDNMETQLVSGTQYGLILDSSDLADLQALKVGNFTNNYPANSAEWLTLNPIIISGKIHVNFTPDLNTSEIRCEPFIKVTILSNPVVFTDATANWLVNGGFKELPGCITAPAAPGNLVATAYTDEEIDITWDDNAQSETGYHLERSLLPLSGFTLIADLPAETSFFRDSKLLENTEYYYRVKAIGSQDSDYSNIDSATTFIPTLFTIDTTLPGASNNDQFELPLILGGVYDFRIDFGDGQTLEINDEASANRLHTYASPGVYTVKITGNCLGFDFNKTIGGYNGEKITTLSKWGQIQYNTTESFLGCSNLVLTATDAPDISLLTNLENFFKDCPVLGSNFDVSTWDVAHVINMRGMFNGCLDMNGTGFNSWNVSLCENTALMFRDNRVFNQAMNSWTTTSLTNIAFMFNGCRLFNQPLDNWIMSSVISLESTFNGAYVFNGNITPWDVSSVLNMQSTFNTARDFNQDISGWVTSSVTNMRSTFANTDSFNQDISGWSTGSVSNMIAMFSSSIFNRNISGWDITSLTSAANMFLNGQLSQVNYEALLIGWDAQAYQSNVIFHAGNAQYTAGSPAETAKKNLETAGWQITDGGSVAPSSTATTNQQNQVVITELGQSPAEGRDGDQNNPNYPFTSAIGATEWDGNNLISLTTDRGDAVGGSYANYFADALFAGSGKKAVMVEAAQGATGLTSTSSGANWGGVSLRAAAETKTNSAMAQIGVTLPYAAIWMQGERDAKKMDADPTYTKPTVKAAMQSVIDWWKSTYPGSPFFIVKTAKEFDTGFISNPTGVTTGYTNMRAIQDEIAAENAGVFIAFDTLPVVETGGMFIDLDHYNYVANSIIGNVVADSMNNEIESITPSYQYNYLVLNHNNFQSNISSFISGESTGTGDFTITWQQKGTTLALGLVNTLPTSISDILFGFQTDSDTTDYFTRNGTTSTDTGFDSLTVGGDVSQQLTPVMKLERVGTTITLTAGVTVVATYSNATGSYQIGMINENNVASAFYNIKLNNQLIVI